jgi:hypothetical protein
LAKNVEEGNKKYAVKLINRSKLKEQNIEHLIEREI